MMESVFVLMIFTSLLLFTGFLIYIPIKWMIDAIIERDFALFVFCLIPVLLIIGSSGLIFVVPILNGGM